ncbi:hypothetical protein FACS189449_09190 [Alphaproteobacteria bacterium]|nr:hypothetical protein FACS189449_09190 [Alphaproteobacteria bacterium]
MFLQKRNAVFVGKFIGNGNDEDLGVFQTRTDDDIRYGYQGWLHGGEIIVKNIAFKKKVR